MVAGIIMASDGLSGSMLFGAIGNAPPLVVASLLRRTHPQDVIPHMLFILCAGAVCLQIDLMSDHLEDHLPPTAIGCVNINWSVVLPAETEEIPSESIDVPTHQNWSASDTTPQPIETMVLDFHPQTRVGRFTPVFRAGATLT